MKFITCDAFRNLILASAICTVANTVYADVGELDTKNAKICQEQILAAKDTHPIVLDYSPTCGYCEQYMPTYLKVAEETPDRSFFRINLWDTTEEVRKVCLGEKTDDGGMYPVPTTKLVEKKVNPTTGDAQIIETDAKMGVLTEDELINFIKVTNQKQYIGQLSN